MKARAKMLTISIIGIACVSMLIVTVYVGIEHRIIRMPGGAAEIGFLTFMSGREVSCAPQSGTCIQTAYIVEVVMHPTTSLLMDIDCVACL